MKRKIIGVMTACILGISMLSGCAISAGDRGTSNGLQDDGTYYWRLAHEEYEGDMQDVYAKEFAERLYENSDGKIHLEIYPVGQIGSAPQQCELLQNGGIDFAMVSPGNTGTIVPENQFFSLHFLFPEDDARTEYILHNSVALTEMLNAKYMEKNIQVLDYWQEGPMEWTANKPLTTPADFKGLKFRTMPSPMIVAAYEAYSANPTPMVYAEVYSGLQLKMIDGQENPASAIRTSKIHEVQKCITRAKSNLFVTTLSVNPEFFASLPADIQQIVLDTVDEMKPRSYEIQAEINGNAIEDMQEETGIEVVELTDEQRDAFVEEAQSAYDFYRDLVGESGSQILDKLLEEIEEVNNMTDEEFAALQQSVE